MEINEIQSLIKFVAKSGVSEVELETNDIKLVIKSGKYGEGETIIHQVPVAQAPMQTMVAPVTAPAATPVATETPKAPATEDNSKYIEIKSPMIGTFYRKPNPDTDVFVNVGDDVKVGDTVCIIEAMKLFNEIESEISGKIVKVLVDDMAPVEYDQPLFLVDPS